MLASIPAAFLLAAVISATCSLNDKAPCINNGPSGSALLQAKVGMRNSFFVSIDDINATDADKKHRRQKVRIQNSSAVSVIDLTAADAGKNHRREKTGMHDSSIVSAIDSNAIDVETNNRFQLMPRRTTKSVEYAFQTTRYKYYREASKFFAYLRSSMGLLPEDGTTKVQDGPGSAVAVAWVGFFATIVTAAFFDMIVLSLEDGEEAASVAAAASQKQAEVVEVDNSKAAAEKGKKVHVVIIRQLVFWLCTSLLFNFFVWALIGAEAAASWAYGYILEYTLSVDNLFVFRMVFQGYATPPDQLDRALFWGVAVAVILRFIFFGIGTEIFGLGFTSHCFFGSLLVYSGVKTVCNTEDGDLNPKDNYWVKTFACVLPLHDDYTEDACFFVTVSDDGDMHAPSPPKSGKGGDTCKRIRDDHVGNCSSNAQEVIGAADAASSRGVVSDAPGGDDAGGAVVTNRPEVLELLRSEVPQDGQGQSIGRPRQKVTMLFLVTLTLAIIDVLFAVDSVAAKISSVAQFSPAMNLFLNLSSSAFAMFVLRSVYCLLDIMVHMFRFLNYGVGFVLVLIGVKLIFSTYVDIGMVEVLVSIIVILVASVLASCLIPEEEAEIAPTG